MTKEDKKLQALEDYEQALLSITALAQDSIEPHEAIVIGVQFFSKMAFDMAPSEDVAHEAIATGVSFGLEDSRGGDAN